MGVSSHRIIWSGPEAKRQGKPLLPLAHHLGDGVSDNCSCLFNLLLSETNGDAHLQGGRDNLLGLEVVIKGLQSGD